MNLKEEANRCLLCKNPRCSKRCPISTPIPEIIQLFKEDQIEKAGEILFENNPLSAICAIVCAHENQCMGNCVRGFKGEPVEFYEIEKYISVKNKKDKYYITGSEYNDSECLAIELARFNEGLSSDIDTIGSVAFIMLQVEKKTQKPVSLHYGRNSGNPLGWTVDGNYEVLASEGQDKIEVNTWFTYSYKTGFTISQSVEIGATYAYTGSQYTSPTYGLTACTTYGNDHDGDDYYIGYDGKRYKYNETATHARTNVCDVPVDDEDEAHEAIGIARAYDMIDEIEAFEDLYTADELPKHWGESITMLQAEAVKANKGEYFGEEAEYLDYIETLKKKINNYYVDKYRKSENLNEDIPF